MDRTLRRRGGTLAKAAMRAGANLKSKEAKRAGHNLSHCYFLSGRYTFCSYTTSTS